jgi:hypothetical protein
MAVVFHVNRARFVIDFDGRQFAGDGFGDVDGGLVFACGTQTELFRQAAPAFGGIVSGVAPMGVVSMCFGGECCEGGQQEDSQAWQREVQAGHCNILSVRRRGKALRCVCIVD